MSTLVAAAVLTAFAAPRAVAQGAASGQGWNPEEILKTETYVHPPAVVERIITTPRTDISFTQPSADRHWFLRLAEPDRGSVKYYGKGHIYLGGLQVDTAGNRARTLTDHGATSITLVDPRTGDRKSIAAPKGALVVSPAWSPDGKQVAFIADFPDASQLFVADVASGRLTQLTKSPLLPVFVTDLAWTADGGAIVTVLVPGNRGPKPTHGAGDIEDGPQVRLTEGRMMPQVVHASLLEDPHDKALLRYYTTGQLAVIDVKSKAVHAVGAPAMIRSVEASPDGKYFRVTRMIEPFSYRVPVNNFGSVEELWDASGKVIAQLDERPLNEGERTPGSPAPARGGRGGGSSASDSGRRDLQWNPIGPGMVYLQSVFAQSNGGGRAGRAGAGGAGRAGQAQRPQPTSVRYMSWMPPYGPGDTKVIYEGSGRMTGAGYSADGATMFVADSGEVIAFRTADPSKRFHLGRGVTMPSGRGGFGGFGGRGGGRGGFGGGSDTTALGGALAMKEGKNGVPVVVVASDNKTVYLSGVRTPGANWATQAPRPWVDKLDFESGQRSRVFDSPADAYESFVTALDDDYSQFIYTRESPTVIRDAWLRDVRNGTSRQLTHAVDAAPEVTGATRKRFEITRQRDGVKFWVNVTLPKEWTPTAKAPGIIWFYPREYTSQSEYDRSKFNTNINAFPDVPAARPATATSIWVAGGYVFIEPDCPIMGDSGRMNDNYTQDLAENLNAVVDAIVDSGWVDRDRMGIGGHSYGAFSTVNAMTLVPYFKAGIAGDGMYNRSLTPFGFQSERRDFWEGQDTYLDMSPFFRADKLSGALLMYHSIEDQNVGTAPESSIRMLAALQGLGKTAALYMYPYEDHSVATYQTDLDQWARWLAWFDVYVKHPKPDGKAAVQP